MYHREIGSGVELIHIDKDKGKVGSSSECGGETSGFTNLSGNF
jgi:hypothetical protein